MISCRSSERSVWRVVLRNGGCGVLVCWWDGQAAWTELRVLESAVLSGCLADKMHTCVVGAGLVYDDEGNGALRDLFR